MRFNGWVWLACLGVALGVLCGLPTPVTAEEPINVVILVPEGTPELAARVARLESRIAASDTRLALVHSIRHADAVLEFVAYKSDTIKDGDLVAAW